MPPFLTRRIKSFFIGCSLLPLFLFVLLWIIVGIRISAIFVCSYSGIVIATVIYTLIRAWRHRRETIYAAQCKKLEVLIHDIIDLAFVYDNDHSTFYVKFLEAISVKSLSKRGIIDPDAMLRTSNYNREFQEIKCSDAELLALLAAGFSCREIKVIYGLKNLNSVYVKSHRLRGRLSGKMQQLLEMKQLENPNKNTRSRSQTKKVANKQKNT